MISYKYIIQALSTMQSKSADDTNVCFIVS